MQGRNARLLSNHSSKNRQLIMFGDDHYCVYFDSVLTRQEIALLLERLPPSKLLQGFSNRQNRKKRKCNYARRLELTTSNENELTEQKEHDDVITNLEWHNLLRSRSVLAFIGIPKTGSTTKFLENSEMMYPWDDHLYHIGKRNKPFPRETCQTMAPNVIGIDVYTYDWER